MSDYIRAEWYGWTDKILYHSKVTGEDIQKIYNDINLSGNKHITATNIFPIQILPPEPMLFDIFIFYKEKYGHIKGL